MAFDKEKTLAAAQKFADKSQYEKAIKEYLKVIEVDPEDHRVLLQLAACYEKTGKNNEDAARTYEKVAQGYRQQGAYQKALALLKQAQRYLPDDDEVAMSMAELYNALGLPHEAVSQLEKCLSRCEQSDDRRGYARILQMMVRVDSENIQTRTRYAKMLKDDGDLDGAGRQYKLALAQLLSKERYVDYIQTAREYLKLSPKDEEILHELSQIYIRMERYNDAVTIMSELPFSERPVEIRELFVTCYMKLRRYHEAVDELKAIAREYEDYGDRPDMVEAVWQRVKQIAPNDPDAAMALGDEPPLLSESALNVVSPGIEREKQEARMAAQQAAVASEMERMLSMKFTQAMDAYRRGNVDEVLSLCHQIVDCNEQHMPALRLMSQIYENMGDNVSMAQVERKLAKAVYESDPDEAVMHILKAEHCTPRAWENFNLMLVFGFEPQKYGMSPPEMGRPSASGQRMSVAGYMGGATAGSTAERQPVPTAPMAPTTAPHAAAPMPGGMPPRPATPPPMARPSAASIPAVGRGLNAPDVNMGIPNEVMGQGYPQMGIPSQRPSAVNIAAVPPARPAAPPPRQAVPSVSVPPVAPAAPVMPPAAPVMSATPAAPANIPAMPPVAPAAPANMPGVRPVAPSVAAVSPMMPSVASRMGGAPKPGLPGQPSGPVVQSFNIPAQGKASVHASDMEGDISDLSEAVCDELDDVFDFLVRTPGEALKALDPLDGDDMGATPAQPLMSTTPTQTGWKVEQSSVSAVVPPVASVAPPVGRVPAPQPMGSRASAVGIAPVRQSATPRAQAPVPTTLGQRPGMPSMSRPGVPSMSRPSVPPVAPGRVPVAPAAPAGVPAASMSNIPVAAQMPPATPVAAAPAPAMGIPDSERAHVMEVLQEVDFYASLALLDDAHRMLDALIAKYGDVDVIHEAKVKLG